MEDLGVSPLTPKISVTYYGSDPVKCPICIKEGKKSTLRLGIGRKTCKGTDSHYDEEGIYHHHDGNVTRGETRCSQKHKLDYICGTGCPAPNCKRSYITLRESVLIEKNIKKESIEITNGTGTINLVQLTSDYVGSNGSIIIGSSSKTDQKDNSSN